MKGHRPDTSSLDDPRELLREVPGVDGLAIVSGEHKAALVAPEAQRHALFELADPVRL